MYSIWIGTLLILLLAGCGDYGHHPHYIISQDELVPEVVKEPEQEQF